MTKSKSILSKLLIITILILFFLLGLSTYKTDDLIKNLVVLKLNKSLRNNEHSIYDYSLDNIKVKFWLGDLKINNFEIFLKQKTLDSLRKNNIPKRQLLEGKFTSLHIKGFHLTDLLVGEKIIANKIILTTPQIKIYLNTNADKNKENKFDLDSVFSAIKPNISINNMELQNANFQIIDVTKDSLNTFGIDGFSFTLNDLKIDSTTIPSPLHISYSSFSCGSGKSYLYINDDYDFTMDDFSYNSNSKQFRFTGINIKHSFNKKQYIKETKDDTPFYKISLDHLNIDLSLVNIIHDDILTIKKIDLEKLNVYVYQSKKKEIRPLKTKPLIASMVRSIPMPLFIENIDLNDCLFSYEFQDNSMKEKSLRLDFTHSDISINNITNIDSLLTENNLMNITATSYFMNQGKVDLQIGINLTSKIESFTVKGHLGKMLFADANSIVESLAPVTFINGKVHGVNFNFKSNKYNSKGKMDFHYSDIRLSVLKKDPNAKKNKPLFSLLLNNILKKNNIPNTSKYKTGIINNSFNSKKTILNYLWESIKSGLISSLSLHKKK
jgi:hypothetical protein